MKEIWKPGTMIYPLPAVLVTCGDEKKSNMLTIAWTGTICTDPAMCYISVRPSRYSYDMIKQHMEFTLNLTTAEMARATDHAGVVSGAEVDKWQLTGFTPEKGVMVACPSIKESPLSIECRVKEIIKLGSHDMFIAEVLNCLADKNLIDQESGLFDLGKAKLINYNHGFYYEQGKEIGRFGFSVKKGK